MITDFRQRTHSSRVQASVGRVARDLAGQDPLRVTFRSDGIVEEVMAECEVEGVHYALVRSYSLESRRLLSPREHEIARLVARGLPNKAISKVLDISSWTVATHLRRIFSKLDVTSRAAMVAQLIEVGELELQDDRRQAAV